MPMFRAPGALPFPIPLRIGTDICQITRVYRILAGGNANRFVQRLLNDEERAAVQDNTIREILKRSEGLGFHEQAINTSFSITTRDAHLWRASEWLAGRFAAKEAAIKSHPHLRTSFQRITIRTATSPFDVSEPGAPFGVVRGNTAAGLTFEQVAMFSISHDSNYATAVCLGFEADACDAKGEDPEVVAERRADERRLELSGMQETTQGLAPGFQNEYWESLTEV